VISSYTVYRIVAVVAFVTALAALVMAATLFSTAANETDTTQDIATANRATNEAQQRFFTRIAIEACEANNIQDKTTLELTRVVAQETPNPALRRIEESLRTAIFPCEEFTRQFLREVFRRIDGDG
jgi:hypothetical protein